MTEDTRAVQQFTRNHHSPADSADHISYMLHAFASHNTSTTDMGFMDTSLMGDVLHSAGDNKRPPDDNYDVTIEPMPLGAPSSNVKVTSFEGIDQDPSTPRTNMPLTGSVKSKEVMTSPSNQASMDANANLWVVSMGTAIEDPVLRMPQHARISSSRTEVVYSPVLVIPLSTEEISKLNLPQWVVPALSALLTCAFSPF
ncbi:hypothetical protein RND81_02G185400 [Saponaria officinalis]|uniref:Uncharacterized protein n=1 Tax=Saponaria officinalis TaxID=3572 RepID=A0AAW1MN47_SAPOF